MLVVGPGKFETLGEHSPEILVTHLSDECKELFEIVRGLPELDTADFPNFCETIERSIRSPGGECYKMLEAKEKLFGNALSTYLRITFGLDKDDSPGAPFVLEVWPAGHYSPIHGHGGANAIIRVLHGEINARIFAMLSPNHGEPLPKELHLKKGQFTYIEPNRNQVHQLWNKSDNCCITLQCYQYSKTDKVQYEKFDYIDRKTNTIKGIDPKKDMGYVDFEETMRKEAAAGVGKLQYI